MKRSEKRVNEAGLVLNDPSKSLAVRFRALFLLRSVKNENAVRWICKGFLDPSALLKHELAYCLDTGQEPMVRHEAAEALAAIGDPLDDNGLCKIFEHYSNDPAREVAETCHLALKRTQWIKENKLDADKRSIYDSIDPAPADNENADVLELGRILVNQDLTLWDRYRAMFALRNMNNDQATKALADGLFCNDSALFRHEIAYVLGQIQSPVAIPALLARLQMDEENGMVRHECAEALGSIATDECQRLLVQFVHDRERIVRESCEVALDIAELNRKDEKAE
uniref:Deoxyhypusine hydroxylase n=1 Tax=Globodera rostochiensis TaxID=31243 RepID=A0A914HC08_GLORO